MKREISSPATRFYKLFAPVIALAIFGGYTLSYFSGALNRSGVRGLEWGILFCGILALAAIWSSLKLRRVLVDDRFLYISGYSEEIRIPLSSIADVQAVASPYKTIIVTFATPSKFGRKVMFVPRDRAARDPGTGLHPTVVELKEAIRTWKDPM